MKTYTPNELATGAADLQAIATGQAVIKKPEDTRLQAALDASTLDNPTVFPRQALSDGSIFTHGVTLEDVASGKILVI